MPPNKVSLVDQIEILGDKKHFARWQWQQNSSSIIPFLFFAPVVPPLLRNKRSMQDLCCIITSSLPSPPEIRTCVGVWAQNDSSLPSENGIMTWRPFLNTGPPGQAPTMRGEGEEEDDTAPSQQLKVGPGIGLSSSAEVPGLEQLPKVASC